MNRAALAVLALASTAAFAQSANTTANATASILRPITITKVTDMAFGNVVWTSPTAGTAVMPVTSAGAGPVTVSGGVVGTNGTQTAASFTIGGRKNKTYTITAAPASGAAVTLAASTSSTNLLTVTSLSIANANNNYSAGVATLSASNADTLYVGGTLNVPTTAIEDDYSSANTGGIALKVTVAYN